VASSQPDRDADQIEADLGATRDRLAAAIEDLIDQVHPQRIKQRQVAGAKRLLHTEVEKAKSLVFNARGDLRTDRLAIVGGATAGAVALLVLLRTLVRRRRG
jgi:hypothetical protein